jgi:hypothetical protein
VEDKKVHERKRDIKEEKTPVFVEDNQGMLWCKTKDLCA